MNLVVDLLNIISIQYMLFIRSFVHFFFPSFIHSFIDSILFLQEKIAFVFSFVRSFIHNKELIIRPLEVVNNIIQSYGTRIFQSLLIIMQWNIHIL